LPIDHALRVLADLHASHVRNPALLGLIGSALQSARDIDFLNAPPPEHPLFREVSGQLAALAAAVRGEETEQAILRGLATAARMLARQQDEVAETSCQRLIELDPGDSSLYYNYGLYLKTRGRFREGMLANQTATSLVSEPFEACEWNLGICATGAGESGIALEVWKRMGQTIEMGRFGLPEGRYPQCKVRLAERPLAERSAECDDPGLEETIWIQRLSPCHGIVRSVLFQKLGVDFGDVVLFDGAPMTWCRSST
jgi:hypothetical protein